MENEVTTATLHEQSQAMRAVNLDDKYRLQSGTAFINGNQALVRLLINQSARDKTAGLNTAGLVTGYRGSPLGNVDQALWSAEKLLNENNIKFIPAINEDLGATMCWGTQQLAFFPDEAKVEGVFSMWYGKGPGVDRSGDALKHGSAAGTSPKGGVLVLAGDDHTAKSSTFGHQSEQALVASFIPILYPSNVQECLDYGIYGWAMSRYSGSWVAMKCVTDVIETSSIAEVDPFRVKVAIPGTEDMPSAGVHIRDPDVWVELEPRILHAKLPAAMKFAVENNLNRVIFKAPASKLGIVCAGKAYNDVEQALVLLGLNYAKAAELGIALLKLGMVWPLEPGILRQFATGLDELLVVEEKRSLIEQQIKDEFYADAASGKAAPRVSGKSSGSGGGEWSRHKEGCLLRSDYELNPVDIAHAIFARLVDNGADAVLLAALQARLDGIDNAGQQGSTGVARKPYFCSGCPHNTSTKVPEGSRATAGIGCHYMSQWMNRNTSSYTHMGGEGVPWVAQSPFSKRKHIFTNMGDGTYFHSGSLAIRQAVAANVNMTFKILYNDAAAMTGGQPVDGEVTVHRISQQVAAEGVRHIVVVSDDIEKYTDNPETFAAGTTVHHRRELDDVQRTMREYEGVSVLIYDQTCAAEKRRRRKKKAYPDPARRVVINEAVCEGCGDCSTKSNCLSIEPLDTELGRKRVVNQSTCNKDYSCVEGFCPSFITVEGGAIRKAQPQAKAEAKSASPFLNDLPEPVLPAADRASSILVTGVGGTGVVTIGSILGMAAHVANYGCCVLDMAGLAQKGGAVWSHVQIARDRDAIHAGRIAKGQADAVIGCDLIVTAQDDSLSKMAGGRTQVVVNTNVSPASDFVLKRDWEVSEDPLLAAISTACGKPNVFPLRAQDLAMHFLGDTIFTNPILLGYAWQKGWIPLPLAAITRAIELNGQAVQKNLTAFAWGRCAAADPERVARMMAKPQPITLVRKQSRPLAEVIEYRSQFLAAYQGMAYAQTYEAFLARVRSAHPVLEKNERFVATVARNLFKLMAYKDEYEVARLHSSPEFLASVQARFEGDYKLVYHLAPPLLSKRNTKGELQKSAYGGWVLHAFKFLARLKFLRGSVLDIFGYTEERKMERRLIREYRDAIESVLPYLGSELDKCIELATLPDSIRGYGHVKHKAVVAARERQAILIGEITKKQPQAAREA